MMSVCLFNEPIYFSYTYVPQREHVIDIYLFYTSGFSSYHLTFLSQLLPYFCGKPFTIVDAWIERVMISALYAVAHTFQKLISFPVQFQSSALQTSFQLTGQQYTPPDLLQIFTRVRRPPVKDCRALHAIRTIFPHYFSYRIELCLSESRGGLKFRDVISTKRYCRFTAN